MSTPVTVDLDDLKRLVLATGAYKTVDECVRRASGVLANKATDPFSRDAAEGFEAVHNRLVAVVNQAQRAGSGTLIDWDEPLKPTEIAALKNIRSVTDDAINKKTGEREPGLPFYGISPADKKKEPIYDHLQAKGCIQLGQFIEGIVFPGESVPRFKPDPVRGYGAVLTARGRAKLAEAEKAEAEKRK